MKKTFFLFLVFTFTFATDYAQGPLPRRNRPELLSKSAQRQIGDLKQQLEVSKKAAANHAKTLAEFAAYKKQQDDKMAYIKKRHPLTYYCLVKREEKARIAATGGRVDAKKQLNKINQQLSTLKRELAKLKL